MTFQLTNPSGKKKYTKKSMAGFQAFLQRIVQ